jgi:hypothetical protein
MSVLNLPPEAQVLQSTHPAEHDSGGDGGGSATFFAVVNADGTLARGFRAASAQRLGLGNYEVVFNRDVTAAAYVATIGLSGAIGAANPGEITVVGRAGNTKGIFVTTHSSAGAPADAGFHLAVHTRS